MIVLARQCLGHELSREGTSEGGGLILRLVGNMTYSPDYQHRYPCRLLAYSPSARCMAISQSLRRGSSPGRMPRSLQYSVSVAYRFKSERGH